MRAPLRSLGLLLLLAAGALLGGCTEAEERWTLDRKGGGEYALTLRWDADLWRRVGGVLGPKVMARLAGPGFPLRIEQWRDGLAGLEGVEILALEERPPEAGMRVLHVHVRFARLEQLLRWEVLAGRTVRVEPEPKAQAGDGEPRVTLWMEPIARVPVLDRLAALVAAMEAPPPAAEGGLAARDPGPLGRLGIEPTAAVMVGRMVKGPLAAIRLTSRVETPGELVSIRGRPVLDAETSAAFTWTFDDLRRADADRTVRLRWQMRAFEETPALDHRGQRDPRPSGPTGGAK